MGKIRIKTLGDEQAEMEQKQAAKARKEAKKAAGSEPSRTAAAEEIAAPVEEATPAEEKAPEKKASSYAAKKAGQKKAVRSTKYKAVAEKVDRNKLYSLDEALTILPEVHIASFDESVELHINTTEPSISGNLTLPHGTGKTVRVAVADDAVIAAIEGGKIDFDVLLATPAMMPKMARVAKYLGPRGLMPNPKNGTVTQNPEEAAKKFQAGQVNYKTESKLPLLHLLVGKLSFGKDKLAENIRVAVEAVQTKNVQKVVLKSTMSPGLKIDIATLG